MHQNKFTTLFCAEVSMTHRTTEMKKHIKEYSSSIPFEHVSFYLQRAVSRGTQKRQTTPQISLA